MPQSLGEDTNTLSKILFVGLANRPEVDFHLLIILGRSYAFPGELTSLTMGVAYRLRHRLKSRLKKSKILRLIDHFKSTGFFAGIIDSFDGFSDDLHVRFCIDSSWDG